MNVYFITGATGVVGSALVSRLLDDAHAEVVALVRAKAGEDPEARLHRSLSALGVAASAFGNRLRVLAGDAEQSGFGLTPTEYDGLSERCTHVIHCAGAVRMNLPLADARRAAIEPARNAISLARACRALRKCEFVSTVGIAGRDIRELEERWIAEPRAFHNTYEAAKAEAETLIEAAVREGLPITLHRPSMIVGDSTTGTVLHHQVFYHLVEFLSGRRTLGFVPDFRALTLDVVPVDFVAHALAWSSGTTSTAGKVLHLCAGADAIPLAQLQVLVRHAARERGLRLPPVRRLPARLFRAVTHGLGLIATQKLRRPLRTLPIFLDYLESAQSFANHATRATLQAAGIGIPVPQAYLPRVLSRYFAQGGPSAHA